MGTTKSSSQSTKSITSNSEVKENEPNAIIKPNKDLKNKSLRSRIVHSQPSKLLAFHSCKMHHIKQ